MKYKLVLAGILIFGIWQKMYSQTESLDTSNVVVRYHYTCNTSDAEGEPVVEGYDIALLIGKHIVSQQGFCELVSDRDNDEELMQMLTERQHNVPLIYRGFPEDGIMTIRETILMRDYEMTEKEEKIKWEIVPDTLVMNRYNCKKATATVHGRQWTAWFAEEIPLPFGPWLLGGLPGLILQAEADGVHSFRMVSCSAASCPIKYEKHSNMVKTSRKKFIKYRDKVTKIPAYLTDPISLVEPEIRKDKSIYQFDNGQEFVEMNGHIINMHPSVFIPLDDI